MPRPIRATISLSALAHNLAVARARAGGARIWAILKANGYGHGIERVARALEGADGFGVVDFEEAARLRAAGVRKPILMLEGVFQPEDVPLLAQHRLTTGVHSAWQVALLERAELPGPIDVYLKVNSGMNRLGFDVPGLRAAHDALRRRPWVGAITMMTHFADADGACGVDAQLARFEAMIAPLAPKARSMANSAALLRFAERTRADWVRPGIMLYGCSPFAHRSAESLGLRPAMTLASELIAVQRLARGDRVGYGFTYEAGTDLTIGIVACGYGDGYPRHAPSGTPVLINGRRTRIVGRVSMDMVTVDLTGIPEARAGSPVTLWGEGLSADEVAAAAGTMGYQLLCGLTRRVPVSDAA